MAKEMDATYVNILSKIENAQDDVQEAIDRADDAKSAAESAEDSLKQLIDLVKLRREYEFGSKDKDLVADDIECNTDQLEGYLDSAIAEILNLKANTKKLKEGDV